LRTEPPTTDGRRAEVIEFLSELRDAGLLEDLPAAPARARETWGLRAAGTPLLKLPLTHALPRVLEQVSRVVDRVPRPVARTILLLVAGLVPLCIAAALTHGTSGPPHAVWMLIPLMLAQGLAHECAHALACQRYGVPVREAGVGLLFYIFPVAYVDRTDAYRLTARRQRVVIALAGPATDLLWAAGYAVVVLAAGGDVARLGQVGLIFSLILVARNLNPLMPSDGFQALEAGLGWINFRGRVMGSLLDSLPGARRRSGTTVSVRGRALYCALAVIWLMYLGATATLFLVQLLPFVSGGSK
jgi:putative peptide zinc metalloprotease protein